MKKAWFFFSKMSARKTLLLILSSLFFSGAWAQLPDLTVSSVSGPSVRNVGESFNTTVTVNRTGGNLTNGSYVLVRVYLSTDNNITTSDIQIGESNSSQFLNSTLNASGYATGTIFCNTNIPFSPATYYLGAIVDPVSYHPESNEFNNSRVGGQIIFGQLTVNSPNGGETWTMGQSATITWSRSFNLSGNIQIQFYKGGVPGSLITNSTPVSAGSYTFTVPTNLTPGSDYKIGMSAMSGQVWDFSNNNFTVQSPPLPDLTVASVSGPTARNVGESFNATVTVNRTGGPLTNGTYALVRVYLSTDNNITTSDILVGESNSSQFLNSVLNSNGSASGTIVCNTNIPANPSNYYIGAIVDPVNFHPETNESNNSRAGNQIVFGRLAITAPNGGDTWTMGQPATVSWTYSGNLSGNVLVQFYKGGNPGGLITNSTPVTAGSYTFTVPTNLTPGSDYKIGISALSGQVWDFSDNNFTINQLPDLTVANVNGPTVRNVGESFDVSATVNLSGGPLTNGSYVVVRIYLSTDNNITASDIQIGESNTTQFLNSTLNANGTTSGTINCSTNIPTAPSTYYIGAIADPVNFHPESNENNNALSGNQVLFGQLTLVSPNGGETWTMGQAATITWNWSSNLTGNMHIQFYKGGNPGDLITNSTPVSAGSHTFTVPTTLTAGTDYTIGVSAMSGYVWDFSNSNFTIQGLTPQVSVNPVTGPINTNFHQPGSGFTPNNVAELHFRRPDGSETATVNKNTDASGNYDHYWLAEPGAQIGQYQYWAIDLASGATSNTFNFEVSGEPQLQNPPQNHTITIGSIVMNWSDVGAVSYDVIVDNNEGLGSREINENITATQFEIAPYYLSENTYFWKIIAHFADGSTAESSKSFFHYYPDRQPAPAWIPLYRLYHSSDKDHFYCTTEAQRSQANAAGYVDERIEGYLSAKPFNDPDMVHIYRLYHGQKKAHYYTADGTEKDLAIIDGYDYEGIVGYAYGSSQPDLTPFYHLHKDFTPPNVDHFYTISYAERYNAEHVFGFTYDGIVAYFSPNGITPTRPIGDGQIVLGAGVNTRNGNFQHYNKTSFSIPGRGVPLVFEHIYNSSNVWLYSDIMPLSPGWSHSYNAYVVTLNPQEVNQNVLVVWPDGDIHEYYYDGVSYKCQTPGVYDIFNVISAPTHFTVKKKDQTVYTFITPPGAPAGYPAMLTSVKDRNNNTLTCSYESGAMVRLINVTDAVGRSLTFTYHTDAGREHLIKTVTDNSGGRSINFFYDSNDDLVEFRNALNRSTYYGYDPQFPGGHMLKTITLPRGNVITNTYAQSVLDTTRKQVTAQSVSGENSYTFNYDPNQINITVIDAGGIEMRYDYNANDLIDQIYDPVMSAGDRFWYDDTQNPTLPSRVQDKRGYTTTFTYDIRGNVTQMNQPEGVIHKFEYDTQNNITRYTSPRNKITTYTYNGSGNLVSVTDPRGTTSFSRNAYGQVSALTNPNFHTTQLQYNIYGNVSSVTDPLTHTTSYTYDDISRLIRMENAGNQATDYGYDALDLLRWMTNANSNTTNYTYDQNDNLATITNARGGVTTLGYDNQDRLTSRSNNGLPATTYTYRDNGQLQSKTNPNSQTTSYTYYDDGRLQQVNSPNISTGFTYDNNGNITGINETAGAMSFSYDGLNRLTQYSDFYGNTVQYGYDLSSNITTITYPGNRTVYYTYDDDDRLRTVRDWNNHTTTYNYLADGSLSSIVYPNGVVCTYSYDSADRLVGKTAAKSGGTVIAGYSFVLDALGNHTQESVNEPLTIPAVASSNTIYTYDMANRIQSAGSTTYTFDNAGNMTGRTAGGLTTTYTYDTENRLTGINANGVQTLYVYDIFGNRRQASRAGVITRYVLDINGPMSQVLMETDGSNNPRYYYIYGLGLISRISADGTTTRYYHSDFRGSTIAMTDPGQNITHQYVYDAFGSVLDKVEADYNPFRYVGTLGVMDEANGLLFMRARYYDPETGRFLSEDPVWDVNLYVYANSNPITNIDPAGKLSEEAEKRKILLKQLQYYQEQSAYYEQKELRQQQYQIFAGLISDITGVIHPAIALTNASTGLVASIAYGDGRGAAKYTFNAIIAKYSWMSGTIIKNLHLSTKVAGISKSISDLSFFGIEKLSNWFWDKKYKR